MEEFVESISTLNWWISVVLVGVVLNISSQYIKVFFEEKYSRFSYFLFKKVECSKKKRDFLIESAKKSVKAKNDLIRLEFNFHIEAIQDSIFSVISLILYLSVKMSKLIRIDAGGEWTATNSYFLFFILFVSLIFVFLAVFNLQKSNYYRQILSMSEVGDQKP